MRYQVLVLPIVITILVLSGLAGKARAGLSISPAFLEVSLNNGTPSGQFQISNTGDEVERYRVKMVYFTFSRDGGFRELPDDDHSLAPLIKFNPKEFAIPPKSRQAVRFYIPNQGRLKNGEYWAAMQLESLKTSEARSSDDKGRNFRFQVVTNIVVPIFASYGEVRYTGVLKDVRLVPRGEGYGIETVVVNTGQGRLFVVGEYELVSGAGELAAQGSLSRAYVMPGGERALTADLNKPLPAGSYTLKVKYSSSQLKQPLVEEIAVSGSSRM
jgi:P pilus assembly chaperone PapD